MKPIIPFRSLSKLPGTFDSLSPTVCRFIPAHCQALSILSILMFKKIFGGAVPEIAMGFTVSKLYVQIGACPAIAWKLETTICSPYWSTSLPPRY